MLTSLYPELCPRTVIKLKDSLLKYYAVGAPIDRDHLSEISHGLAIVDPCPGRTIPYSLAWAEMDWRFPAAVPKGQALTGCSEELALLGKGRM